MDNRSIGIFDSGLGGLTCIPNLFKYLPEERVVYFGDTGRTPYGSKSVQTIKTYTKQIADFLVSNDVKMLVIACNTISCTCIPMLQESFPDIPIIGIVEPTAKKIARTCDKTNNVGIIATKVTIFSRYYEELIKENNPVVNVFGKATPAFVPLIEEGIIENDIMDLTIKYYVDHFIRENKIDTLILGCTHYPLIRKNINTLYPNIKIVNPSYEIIDEIKNVLTEKNMLAYNNDRENVFYASDLSGNYVNMIKKILQAEDSNLIIKFKNLDI